jgi:hypothetical protein
MSAPIDNLLQTDYSIKSRRLTGRGLQAGHESGVGSAVITMSDGLIVGAIVAVNALGDGIDPATGRVVAGVLAVLTLAMGIGAATTMYSVIYNVLLNPFPYTDLRRMVDVIIQDAENPERIEGALAIPEFRAFIDCEASPYPDLTAFE